MGISSRRKNITSGRPSGIRTKRKVFFMPDISLETRQRSASGEQEKSWLIKQQAELHAARAADNFHALDSLRRGEAWKLFYDEALAPAVKEMHDAALDVETRSAAQREAAAQQHAFGVKLLGLLEERRAFWAKAAGIKIE